MATDQTDQVEACIVTRKAARSDQLRDPHQRLQIETRSVLDYIYSLPRKRDAIKHIRNVTYCRGRVYFIHAKRPQSTHTVTLFTTNLSTIVLRLTWLQTICSSSLTVDLQSSTTSRQSGMVMSTSRMQQRPLPVLCELSSTSMFLHILIRVHYSWTIRQGTAPGRLHAARSMFSRPNFSKRRS